MRKCAYRPGDGYRCAKAACRGAYCKAHAPSRGFAVRLADVRCDSCDGAGFYGNACDPFGDARCSVCRGRGTVQVPAFRTRQTNGGPAVKEE